MHSQCFQSIWCTVRQAVFYDNILTINTKRAIYRVCVLSVLQYGGECWILMREIRLFPPPMHRHYEHTAIRETYFLREMRERWGDSETIAAKLQKHRLEWLGHLAKMPDYRMPKITIFSWLPQPSPSCGPKRKWRDVANNICRLLTFCRHMV